MVRPQSKAKLRAELADARRTIADQQRVLEVKDALLMDYLTVIGTLGRMYDTPALQLAELVRAHGEDV